MTKRTKTTDVSMMVADLDVDNTNEERGYRESEKLLGSSGSAEYRCPGMTNIPRLHERFEPDRLCWFPRTRYTPHWPMR